MPSIRILFVALALFAVAGCATKPTPPQVVPPDTTPIKSEEATPHKRAMIRTELASGYYQRGQMDIALEELATAEKLDPEYPKIYNVYGLVYAMLGEKQKAEESFRRAVALAPNDSEIRENWGAYLCATGRPRDALPEFEQALRDPLYKTPEIALINAGKCSVALGDSKGGEEYFKRALGVSPGNPIVAYNLALLTYRQARLGEARVWLRRVMQLPTPPAEALFLGMCIERKDGDKDAERSYESQLRNRFPDSPEAKAITTGACE